jgi:hypothetical protein
VYSKSHSRIILGVKVPSFRHPEIFSRETSIHFDHLPRTVQSVLDGNRPDLLRHPPTRNLSKNAQELEEIILFECHPTQPANRKDNRTNRDYRSIRDDFLSLKEDTESLLDFLNRHGLWGEFSGYERNYHEWNPQWAPKRPREKQRNPNARGPRVIVPPGYFWHYRALLQERLEKASQDPATWFASTTAFPALQPIPEYPFFGCSVGCARDAIEASFSFDFLKQVPTSLCAREDCRKLFFVTRQGKKFCSEKCARCVVMRRSRALEKDHQLRG